MAIALVAFICVAALGVACAFVAGHEFVQERARRQKCEKTYQNVNEKAITLERKTDNLASNIVDLSQRLAEAQQAKGDLEGRLSDALNRNSECHAEIAALKRQNAAIEKELESRTYSCKTCSQELVGERKAHSETQAKLKHQESLNERARMVLANRE